jgi:hypothetical protein
MWTIETAGEDRVFTEYEDPYGHRKYLKGVKALNRFRKLKIEPWHYKRLLLDGIVVRVHLAYPER